MTGQTIPNERSKFERPFGKVPGIVSGPARPAPPLRARYDRRREEIVDAAPRASSPSGGSTRRSISELAEAIGLAAGGLYHYVGSKEELLRAICDELLEPLLPEPRRSSARPRAGQPTGCGSSCGSGSSTSSPTATTCSSSSRSAT